MVEIKNMNDYTVAVVKEAETIKEGVENFCSGNFKLLKYGEKNDGVFFARPLEIDGTQTRKTLMLKAVVIRR